jgi:hypothetical protein
MGQLYGGSQFDLVIEKTKRQAGRNVGNTDHNLKAYKPETYTKEHHYHPNMHSVM